MDKPTFIIEYQNELYFDTEIYLDENEDYKTYDILYEARDIKPIIKMFEESSLNDNKKGLIALHNFYYSRIPNHIKAGDKFIQFMTCNEKGIIEDKNKSKDTKPLYQISQDEKYMDNAINFSYNNLLIDKPDLHWWDYNNCLFSLKEECMFTQIISNRDAHNKGKATDEQKKSMRDYPEIYRLNIKEKKEIKKPSKWDLMERELDQFKNTT